MISANARLYEYVMPFGIVCSPPVYQFTNLPICFTCSAHIYRSCMRTLHTTGFAQALRSYFRIAPMSYPPRCRVVLEVCASTVHLDPFVVWSAHGSHHGLLSRVRDRYYAWACHSRAEGAAKQRKRTLSVA